MEQVVTVTFKTRKGVTALKDSKLKAALKEVLGSQFAESYTVKIEVAPQPEVQA